MKETLPMNQSNLLPTNFEEATSIAQAFAKSGLFQDSRDPHIAVVKVMAGAEIGLPPFAAMKGIHIIKGQPTLAANVMAGAVKRSGRYNYRVTEHTDQTCTLTFYERWNGAWEEVGTSTVTIAELRRAGSQNLDKYPKNMLFARAISNGVRFHCPDVFYSSVYTPDEMGAEVDEGGEVLALPTPEAPVSRVANDTAAMLPDGLKSDTETLKALRGEVKELAAKVFTERETATKDLLIFLSPFNVSAIKNLSEEDAREAKRQLEEALLEPEAEEADFTPEEEPGLDYDDSYEAAVKTTGPAGSLHPQDMSTEDLRGVLGGETPPVKETSSQHIGAIR